MGVTAILSVRNLVKRHRTPRGMVHAVTGVSFDLAPGEVLGLVGESGCGKSTLGRAILRLDEPDSGTVTLDGQELTGLPARRLRPLRRHLQMVFQDPYASLNPRRTVGDLLAEPFQVHGVLTRAERRVQVASLLSRVGLAPEHATRFPSEFSGGQRQRIGIARAIALSPKVVVCDEAVSALDVSIQAQVLNLLLALQREFGLAYLFISHDLSVISHIADRIAVMYLGRIVEIGSRRAVLGAARHPYTQALFSAIPGSGRSTAPPIGEPPSPLDPPPGCAFHPRCPLAIDRCRHDIPVLRTVAPGLETACHRAEETA